MKFITIVAFSSVLAAPTFAQVPNTSQQPQAVHPAVHVYAPNYYEPRHEGQTIHPDHQLGSNRTN
jgi:hypothetical protein